MRFSEGVTEVVILCYLLSLSYICLYFTCSDVVDESFADLTKVQGLRGIYIASQITLSPGLIRVGPEHISTLITFDRGREWKRLETPMFDEDGQPIVCNMVSMHCT